MGCAASKFDQLPAVSLCRDRCRFLDDALQQSYALADAHVAYMQSLKTLGPTLKHFFDQNLKSTSVNESAVKPPEQGSPPSSPDHSLSSSNSDSHIQFDTDLEDEETDKDKSYHNFHGVTYENSEFSESEWITPPPPAPRSGAWDYLNFFDKLYERYELSYSSNKPPVKKEEESHELKEKQMREVVSVKNVDDAENKVESNPTSDVNESKKESCKQSVSELIDELQVLFEKASDSGNEVLKMLDTGKFRYHHKKSVYQGSTKIFHMISSNSSETESLVSNDEIDSSQNLSSVLRKLCMWETKLYDEVKAEEKLRIIHAKTCRQMKSLNQKGGNARRVDSTRTLIRAVSIRIRVAVQVIYKIAIAINKLMDEELWPQVNELIHRLFGMWNVLLECHASQCQKLMEAKCLDSVALNEKLNDGDLEVAMRLKLELQNWSLSFSSWIEAIRGFVKALSGWLRKCILYEPDETADGGVSPSSPGSGAPLVFVILNKWSEALDSDKLSEKEVAEAIHGLLLSVNRVLEQHNAYLQQKMIADKDMERKVKMLEKEGQKLNKLVQARVKKMTRLAREESDVLLPRDTAGHNDIREANSLQFVLKQIFMAMEKLAIHSSQAYEELHDCIEKSKAAQGNP